MWKKGSIEESILAMKPNSHEQCRVKKLFLHLAQSMKGEESILALSTIEELLLLLSIIYIYIYIFQIGTSKKRCVFLRCRFCFCFLSQIRDSKSWFSISEVVSCVCRV